MKVVDMHCDTISRLYRHHSSLYENEYDVDILKMKKGDYLLQNFAMFIPLGESENPEKDCLTLIDRYYTELQENHQWIAPVYKYQDIENNSQQGKMSALLTLEEGDVVFNDLMMLRNYYRLGVRMICLTWNYKNAIGSPNFTPDIIDRFTKIRHLNVEDGLTPFGIEYIREMERLGIIIDVSHLGDKGFYDVVKYTTKPFVASHSNARSICNVARNLSDDMILQLSKKGGVMGLNFCADFLDEQGIGSIESIIKHIDHIVHVGGIDCVGLGSDFDGISKRDDLSDASLMQDLYYALLEHGYDNESIEKIFYKNVLRVYKEVLG